MLQIALELVDVAWVDLRSLAFHQVSSAHLTSHLSLKLLVAKGLVPLVLAISLLEFLHAKFELLDLFDVLTLLLGCLILDPVKLRGLLNSLLTVVGLADLGLYGFDRLLGLHDLLDNGLGRLIVWVVSVAR